MFLTIKIDSGRSLSTSISDKNLYKSSNKNLYKSSNDRDLSDKRCLSLIEVK